MWTENQLAEHTNTSVSLWRQHRVRGTGPKFLKLGRAVRYRPEDVTAWLESRERTNTLQFAK